MNIDDMFCRAVARNKLQDCFLVYDQQFERAGFFAGGVWNLAGEPFAAIQHKTWSVNSFAVPIGGILILPRSPLLRGERVPPAEPVPIVDVKCERHEIFPESRLILEFRQPSLRWRTTAAPLRGEKLKQMNALRPAFESKVAGACD